MVNCKECGQAIFRTDPYRFVNKEDAEDLGEHILGYTIPFYFCSDKCRESFSQYVAIEEFPNHGG